MDFHLCYISFSAVSESGGEIRAVCCVMKFETNFHTLVNKGSLVEICIFLRVKKGYLAIFFILIWKIALFILHRGIRKNLSSKFFLTQV